MAQKESQSSLEKLEFRVLSKYVGRIIGKGGENIKSIKQITNTQITFVDVVPLDEERKLCIISGASIADVEAAKAEITRKVKELKNASRQLKLEFRVPSQYICGIIGKQGSNIKYIQEKTNTKISFPDMPTGNKHRICQIIGNTELDLENARFKIEEYMAPKLEADTKKREKHDGKTHRHNKNKGF